MKSTMELKKEGHWYWFVCHVCHIQCNSDETAKQHKQSEEHILKLLEGGEPPAESSCRPGGDDWSRSNKQQPKAAKGERKYGK